MVPQKIGNEMRAKMSAGSDLGECSWQGSEESRAISQIPRCMNRAQHHSQSNDFERALPHGKSSASPLSSTKTPPKLVPERLKDSLQLTTFTHTTQNTWNTFLKNCSTTTSSMWCTTCWQPRSMDKTTLPALAPLSRKESHAMASPSIPASFQRDDCQSCMPSMFGMPG